MAVHVPVTAADRTPRLAITLRVGDTLAVVAVATPVVVAAAIPAAEATAKGDKLL